MIERSDFAFASMLQRMIVREINGDGDNYQGQLRSLYTAQNWDTVMLTKGKIFAYDTVLKMMDEVMRQLNDEPEPRVTPATMRPN